MELTPEFFNLVFRFGFNLSIAFIDPGGGFPSCADGDRHRAAHRRHGVGGFKTLRYPHRRPIR